MKSLPMLLLVTILGCSSNKDEDRTISVFNGQVSIDAGTYQSYRFTVSSSMKNAILNGEYITTEGGNKDVNVLLMNDLNYINWQNGNASNALYFKERITTDRFSLNISQPGTYYFILSNTFSIITDKRVDGTVTLDYKEKAKKLVAPTY